MIRPRKLKVKRSTRNYSCLYPKAKRFKGGSSECKIGSLNENDPSEIEESGVASISAVLSNDVILHEIFKFLSPPDQRICCEVSEKWRAIAGPMIFEYHLEVDNRYGIRAKVSKGYLNPQIAEINFLPKGEMEFLQTLRNPFLSLEFRGDPWKSPYLHQDHQLLSGTRDFVKKFRTQVYKLSCSHYSDLYKFFREPPVRDGLQLLPDFPNCEEHNKVSLGSRDWLYFRNCEEYREGYPSSFDWFSSVTMPWPITNLRRVYLGSLEQQFHFNVIQTETPKILQMIPNLQEIYGVPYTMIGEFEKVKKLHLVRSIRFHRVDDVNLETHAFKTMVQLGMKFKFLRIERDFHDDNVSYECMVELMRRTTPHFENLLKIGKDTLEHLVLHISRYGHCIDLPETMSALKHITLKTYCGGPVYFPKGFNFSKKFPNLTAITFDSLSLDQCEWGGSWWNSKGVPGWTKFRKGIRNLRCGGNVSRNVEEYLLRQFPSVKRIEFVGFDANDDDGIIYY